MRRYVIVGDGVAGARAAIKIREADSEGEIHVFTDEAYPFYYRVRFPDLIAGEIDVKDIIIHSAEYYRNRKIDLHLQERIAGGNLAKREVVNAGGKSYSYDLLLMATGGNAFVPPIQGTGKKGVFTLRTMQDAIDFKTYAQGIRRAILVGGGLVGLETGGALLRRGIRVAVIENNPRILPRQTDSEGAQILQGKMEQMGFTFYLQGQADEILGKDRVEGLRLKDGTTIEGQLVIISAGVRPNVALAKTLGLEVNHGILVDDQMKTKTEGVFAAGDAAEHQGRVYGIWPAAQRQGETAGITMAGGRAAYEGTVVSNKLKVVGIQLTAAGEIDPEGKLECLVKSDREKCTYCKVAFKEDQVVGCIVLGDAKETSEILDAVEKKMRGQELKASLLKEGFDFK